MNDWSKEDIEIVLKQQIRDRNYSLKMKRMAKDPERKAYWHGKAAGELMAIRAIRWWLADRFDGQKGQ